MIAKPFPNAHPRAAAKGQISRTRNTLPQKLLLKIRQTDNFPHTLERIFDNFEPGPHNDRIEFSSRAAPDFALRCPKR
jgi:hypothetical protein